MLVARTTGRRSSYKERSTRLYDARRRPLSRKLVVSKIIAIVGSMVGGYAGRWAGAFVGVMTAFFLSVVGTGLGVYAGRRMVRHFGV